MAKIEDNLCLNSVRIAIAIAVIRLHAKLQNRGHIVSIPELCSQLAKTREIWKTKCEKLQKEVNKLRTERILINSLNSSSEQDSNKNRLEIFAADSPNFFSLQNYPRASDDVDLISNLFVSGIRFIDDSIENSWTSEFTLTSAQILSKSFEDNPCLHRNSKIIELMMDLIEKIISKIASEKEINRQINQQHFVDLTCGLVTGLEVTEMSLVLVLEQMEKVILRFESDDFCCEFENFFYLFSILELILSKSLENFKNLSTESKNYLRKKISEVYLLATKWPLVRYKLSQIIFVVNENL